MRPFISAVACVEALERRTLLANEAVVSFTLINADTDQPIGLLTDGAVLNFRTLPTRKLNVRADVAGSVASVRFGLDSNANYRTENTAPYALAGDTSGDYKSWTPSLGAHTLVGTPYTGSNASGTAGTALPVAFQVIDQAVTDPVALQVSATALSFGQVTVGQSASAQVTLTNPSAAGGPSLTILSTGISGSSAAAFGDDFNDATDLVLSPGQSATLNVTFTPSGEGAFTASLAIQHSGNNSPTTVSLSGSGFVSNHAPVLAAIGDRSLGVNTTVNVPISATDADNDAIAFSAANLPSFATLTDNGNGTGLLALSPGAGTVGQYTVTIVATDDGGPVLSDSETFRITVTDGAISVVSLTLMDADTDQPLGLITDGSVINLKGLPTRNLNVRADVAGAVQSVRFALDSSSNYRTENSAPYSLAGDDNGNYKPWTPSLGEHTLRATPYPQDSAAGTAGTALTVRFRVVEGGVLTANPTSLSFTAQQNGTAAPKTFTLGTSDGATGVQYTATSDSVWLGVSPASGTANGGPLTVSVNTAGLPLGTHNGLITLRSPTHGVLKIPVALQVQGSFVADQIHLSWVQDPSTALTVVWRTMNTATSSDVQFRKVGDSTWLTTAGALRVSGTTGTLHQTTLTSLTPDTAYEYRVSGDGGSWSPVFTTHTMAPLGPATFDAVYFADTGLIGRLDGLATGTAQVIKEIAALGPDLLLPGGDYAYYNTDTRFGTLNNTIDQWFNQNQTLFSQIPIMPTYGNHEVLLGESYTSWAQRFATPQGFDGQRNYSFDVGEAHFVSILAVSETSALSTASYNWLRDDLAAARAAGRKWIIPYFHVSPFADGSSHPSNTALRAQLGPLFEQYGVRIVLASHDQSYERTYPLVGVSNNITRTSTSLSGYDADDGVVWVKVSPAGKLSSKNGNFSRFQTDPAPFWTAVRDDTMHHFSRVTVSSNGTVRAETYGLRGDGTPPVIIDSFDYSLGTSAPAAPFVVAFTTTKGNKSLWSADEQEEPDAVGDLAELSL